MSLLWLINDGSFCARPDSNDSLGGQSRATASGVAHQEGKSAEAGPAPAPRRFAKCVYGGSGGPYAKDCDHGTPQPVPDVDPGKTLAFFKARPDKDFDDYYCGCFGWD